MKLLFTTEYYPPFLAGGRPVSIRDLAVALVERGHRVSGRIDVSRRPKAN